MHLCTSLAQGKSPRSSDISVLVARTVSIVRLCEFSLERELEQKPG